MTRTLEELRSQITPALARQVLEERLATFDKMIAERFLTSDLEELNPSLSEDQRTAMQERLAEEIRTIDDLRAEVKERLAVSDDALLGKNRAARRRLAKATAKNGATEED